MKTLLLSFALSTVCWGSEFPTYLEKLNVSLWTSALSRLQFEFHPGRLKKCERKEGNERVDYDCETEPVTLTLPASFDFPEVHFEKVGVSFWYSSYESKNYRDYLFRGNAVITQGDLRIPVRVLLRLLGPTSEPHLTGYVHIPELDLKTKATASP